MFWWKRNWNFFFLLYKTNFQEVKEFYKYVGENFKSPNSAKGQIKVAFVVQIDGTLKDFKIIEGLNSDMNVEALRVLSPQGPNSTTKTKLTSPWYWSQNWMRLFYNHSIKETPPIVVCRLL
jgi:hypothetical protein